MNFEAVKLTRAARGLGGAARALAFDLAIYAGDGGEVCVSAQRLADDLGTDVRWVRRLMTELINYGLLAVAKKGNGRGQFTTYRFVVNSGEKSMVSDSGETMVYCAEKGGQIRRETMVYRPSYSKYKQDKQANAHAPAREQAQDPDEAGGSAERWGRVMERLRREVYPDVFEPWLAPVECRRLAPDEIVLAAPNDFFRRWIEGNLAALIAEAAREELGLVEAPALAVVVQEEPEADQGGGSGCRIIGLDP